MRKLLVLLALVAAIVGLAVSTAAQDRESIPELLTNDADGRYTTLLAAVEAAGLGEALSGEGPFTVLAPTNDAFTAALEALGLSAEDLLADTETLTTILTYHVIPGRFQLRDITSGPEAETLQGETVQFNLEAGVLTVNGVGIIDVDGIASNGVVHAIDGVLLPPSLMEAMAAPAEEATEEATPEPTEEPAVAGVPAERDVIPAVLAGDADARFSTLVAAVEAAGLVEALSGEGPFTVLAPTNDAFTAALEALGVTAEDLLANTELLTTVLTYHVVPGRLQLRDITSSPEVETLQGEPLQFNLEAGVLTVGGANIVDVDLLAGNGVIHVIDGVLLPPSVAAMMATPEPTAEPTAEPTPTPVAGVADEGEDIPTLLTNDVDGRYTTLLAAVTAAGLGEALAGEGPFTVLAPTNDAFEAAFAALGITAEDALANTDLLTSILTYHVIPGRFQLRDITTGPSVATLEGSTVQFNLTRGVLTVNNINISDVDAIASNGVVHAIDGVLLPPSLCRVRRECPRGALLARHPERGRVDQLRTRADRCALQRHL
jgi:transforming growth factor-beta-induced protein